MKDGRTFTYMVHALGTCLVKIGKSWNPRKRLGELQTGSPLELRLHRVLDGDHEAALHAKYDRWRVRGEWFNIADLIGERYGFPRLITAGGPEHRQAFIGDMLPMFVLDRRAGGMRGLVNERAEAGAVVVRSLDGGGPMVYTVNELEREAELFVDLDAFNDAAEHLTTMTAALEARHG